MIRGELYFTSSTSSSLYLAGLQFPIAAPRMNVNGDGVIRAYRIDASSGSRFFVCSSRRSTGFRRSGASDHVVRLLRGVFLRAARPSARRYLIGQFCLYSLLKSVAAFESCLVSTALPCSSTALPCSCLCSLRTRLLQPVYELLYPAIRLDTGLLIPVVAMLVSPHHGIHGADCESGRQPADHSYHDA